MRRTLLASKPVRINKWQLLCADRIFLGFCQLPHQCTSRPVLRPAACRSSTTALRSRWTGAPRPLRWWHPAATRLQCSWHWTLRVTQHMEGTQHMICQPWPAVITRTNNQAACQSAIINATLHVCMPVPTVISCQVPCRLADAGLLDRWHHCSSTRSCALQCHHAKPGCLTDLTTGSCSPICRSCTTSPLRYVRCRLVNCIAGLTSCMCKMRLPGVDGMRLLVHLQMPRNVLIPNLCPDNTFTPRECDCQP
jgi:hypothetical protein